MTIKSYGSTEILQVVEAVAREKGISRDSILAALEETIQVAAKRKYGMDEALVVKIDRKSGEIKIYREMLVVADEDLIQQQNEAINNHHEDENRVPPGSGAEGVVPRHGSSTDYSGDQVRQEEQLITKISLSEARLQNSDANPGDTLYEQLPPLDLSRLVAHSSKNIIMGKVREIERDKQYQEFADRIGTIVQGVVEKVDPRSLIIKIGGAEAILRHDQMIRTDHYKQGDKIRAYLVNVDPEARGPQLILSRTNINFVAQLMAGEVPEIDDGTIEIKAIVRDPGSRAKVAVYAPDTSIDPIGSSIGIKGSRIQAVSSELNGEKIDVALWSSDTAQFVINALAPAQVQKVIMDEEKNRIEVIVPDHQLSPVIGRRGQNIRLVSQLVGWNIGVMTESEESQKRGTETNRAVEEFMYQLDIDDMLAQLLSTEGYSSVRELADASIESLMQIQGLDEAISAELIFRAQEAIQRDEDAMNSQQQEGSAEASGEDGMSAEEQNVAAPTPAEQAKDEGVLSMQEIKSVLAYNRIRTMKDIADLAADELGDILEKHDINLRKSRIEEIIMSARKKVYFHIINSENKE